MQLIDCSAERHSAAILAIFNDAILNSTALYDYRPRPPASMEAWFAAKAQGSFPVIGAEDDSGRLMGFASYGTFRAWPAYKYSAEHSIYLRHDCRGQGLGTLLLAELVRRAGEQQLHTLVAGIDSENHISIKLHEKAGFQHAGTVKQAAYKFERWLDLAFYQLLLPTPLAPRGDA